MISGSTQKIEFKKEMLVEKTVLVRGKDMVGDGEEDALKEVVGCVGCEEAVSVEWEGHVAFVGWDNALDGRKEDILSPLQNVVPFNDVFLFSPIDSGLSSNPSNHL